MKTTNSKAVTDGYIRATYGEDAIGDQAPRFSMTAEISSRPGFSDRSIHSCGQLHDEIRAHFPELSHLIKWHLATDGIPMHYIANAKYWHDLHTGNGGWDRSAHDPDPAATFVSHCIELDGETLADLLEMPWKYAEIILASRVGALREAYRIDVG